MDKGYDRIVAPTVSRHFDFLETLSTSQKLDIDMKKLKIAMSKLDFIIGSAPVGPTTVERLLKYTGKIPTVRFGSTETCLQVMGIPRYLDEKKGLRFLKKDGIIISMEKKYPVITSDVRTSPTRMYELWRAIPAETQTI